MEPNKPYPVIPYMQRAVLLVFFKSLDSSTQPQRALLTELVDSLKETFRDRLRVLRIEEVDHPAIVQCFFITQMPAFVLVRQGVELWRQEGMADEATLVPLIEGLIMPDPAASPTVNEYPQRD